MRNALLVALSASVLCATLVRAQAPPQRTDRPADGRSVVPGDPKQPVNALPERSAVRTFVTASDQRTTPPTISAPRLSALGSDTRSHWEDAPRTIGRTLIEKTSARNPSLGRSQDGDKVNRVPEASAPRFLRDSGDQRTTLPPSRTDRDDRRDRDPDRR